MSIFHIPIWGSFINLDTRVSKNIRIKIWTIKNIDTRMSKNIKMKILIIKIWTPICQKRIWWLSLVSLTLSFLFSFLLEKYRTWSRIDIIPGFFFFCMFLHSPFFICYNLNIDWSKAMKLLKSVNQTSRQNIWCHSVKIQRINVILIPEQYCK